MKTEHLVGFEPTAAQPCGGGALPVLDFRLKIRSLSELLSVTRAFIGKTSLSTPEQHILKGIAPCKDAVLLETIRRDLLQGNDPLGTVYCQLKGALERRPGGQTFTPRPVVEAMMDWAARQADSYARVVDPGAGSGRFTFSALAKFRKASAVAIERDAVLALVLRAGAAIHGVTQRLQIVVEDFRDTNLPAVRGKTLFIGNPPYVRHHDVSPEWKTWYSDRLKKLGHGHSQLAGLHLHFFLKVVELARKGDEGCFVTAAEWLDVNYGKALRDLLSNGLGGKAVYTVSPEIRVFDDAMVSAAITCFAPGAEHTSIYFKKILHSFDLNSLKGGREVSIKKAHSEPRWSTFLAPVSEAQTKGFVALGELFKVSRGQVTGLNKVWIAGPKTPSVPKRFMVPCVTKATDITRSPDHRIRSLTHLRRVVSLPASLNELTEPERKEVEAFLVWAKEEGGANGYIATHREPWWRVELKPPAPIIVTYMGRRPPVFAVNLAGARLINVAHAVFPRENLSEDYLDALATWLNANVSIANGRAYAGGLIKFEPSEIMRLRIPPPAILLRENNNDAEFSGTGERVASG
jgi:hypothetical protein